MTTARNYRGNPAEIPREVKFLAISREFRGNGNLNPDGVHSEFWHSRSPRPYLNQYLSFSKHEIKSTIL